MNSLKPVSQEKIFEFRNLIYNVLENSHNADENQIITPDNVFQKAKINNRQLSTSMVDQFILEGSGITGQEHWVEFYNNFLNGKSSIILAEHKSNLDVILFHLMMKRESEFFQKSFEDIVFIAGRKLNEESLVVKLFAEVFNRLIVVPKSELSDASDEEMNLAYKINYSTQQFIKQNQNNYIYFIYPTGTRSRPYAPESYQGITETINYMKKFDQVIFMSTDGNCMFPMPNTPMDEESIFYDKITIHFSKPYSVEDFISKFKKKFEVEDYDYDNFKVFLTQIIMDKIHKQKPVPPWDELWAKACKQMVENKEHEC